MVKTEADNTYMTLDGQQLKAMVEAALLWLRQHQAMINALNVFPVPDGDTGTNMSRTMTSAWNEIANSQDIGVGEVASKVAHGALMGARGNSGVILSQIWRGFARSLDHQAVMSAGDLAHALRLASDTAYKGVVKPVEGTILTVIREVAEEAELVAPETPDLRTLFEHLVARAKAAEARTPTLLPVLRQAGVVDSGGQGLVVILEGMWRYMNGLPLAESERPAQAVDLTPQVQPHPEGLVEFDSAYPYDVQFIIVGHELNVEQIRADIEAMGDCALTVGDARTIKVHVHVPDPGVPISYGARSGSLRDVVVEDMQAQYQEFISGRDDSPALGVGMESPAALLPREPQTIGIVVVAAGAGLEKVFRSLGGTEVVRGGQTMNPSTADILEALKRLPTAEAIVLPNNKNIILAAQQAAELCEKEVVVVPTRSIPQGVAALLAVDQQATLDGNVAAMARAAKEVISAEVTYSVRDVHLNGVDVKEGDVIGLLNGELILTADSFEAGVTHLLEAADLTDRELVTLYYGEDTTAAAMEELAAALVEHYPDLEFEMVYGGQPHYPYLISIE